MNYCGPISINLFSFEIVHSSDGPNVTINLVFIREPPVNLGHYKTFYYKNLRNFSSLLCNKNNLKSSDLILVFNKNVNNQCCRTAPNLLCFLNVNI